MRVSVVMGTHNGAKHIREQLESIQGQSVSPLEIIISDDDSTDGTREVLEAAARRDSRIRLTRNCPALGFSENFLRAAALAVGDLIAFCDQDDIWAPEKLELCVRQFEDNRVTLVTHRALLIGPAGEPLGEFSQGIHARGELGPLSQSPWKTYFGFSMVFRSRLLAVLPAEMRGTDFITGSALLSHDRWVMFLTNICGFTVTLPGSLVYYRQHDANLFGAQVRAFRLRYFERRHLQERALRHAASASAFLACLDQVEEELVRRDFPVFNKALSETFYRREFLKQLSRSQYYGRTSIAARLRSLIGMLTSGVYLTDSVRTFDIRALARDLTVLF